MKSYDKTSTDTELIEGYLSTCDEGAAALLYHRHQYSVFTYIRRQVYNHEDAEELTQDTFSKAFQSLGKLAEPEKLLNWLYGIAAKTVQQWFRDINRKKRQPRDIASVEQILAEGAHPESLITQQGPAEVLERKIRDGKMFAAIAGLPDKHRRVFEAREYEGTPYEEIAREMDITVRNARVLYNRARAQLRTELLKDPVFEDYADTGD